MIHSRNDFTMLEIFSIKTVPSVTKHYLGFACLQIVKDYSTAAKFSLRSDLPNHSFNINSIK